MPLFSRPDGELARDVPLFRHVMPFLMPTRTESAVYFEDELDLTKTLQFLADYNRSHPSRATLFHVFLWAVVHAMHERPRLNRFVIGRRIYQRHGVWISYSAKKKLQDGAPLVVLKRKFEPSSFDELVAKVNGDVAEGRSEKKSRVDHELGLARRVPDCLLRFAVWGLRLLDEWNLLPGSYIRGDPMYASVFIANLGSLKLESAYHHLYEYGTISIFAVLGRTREVVEPVEGGGTRVRKVCSVKYTFDERVEDGLYGAKGLEMLRGWVQDPATIGAVDAGPAQAQAANG
jgi:hypothetical protein